MDDKELEEIEQRANKALLPEWRVPEADKAMPSRYRICTIETVWTPDAMYVQVTPFAHGSVETCEFIAHAREDVPKLIAEIRRLRGELAHK